MSKGKSLVVRKHPTIKTFNQEAVKRVIYVKSKTPYVSALKRVNKMLQMLEKQPANTDKYITLMGMGQAVEKTLSVGCHFQEHKNHRVVIKTASTEVVDEVIKYSDGEDSVNEEDRETELQLRKVSGVEVRIYVV
ncbi:HCL511Cp [Eremothecium sinecaudum]|uniref:HCL511Cp n=1 Tax=Eremothecium sinecaudum TaxID=45286 RepID=A0A109UY44_9SACH|nr:HCL511Cp [Eremothecium sinecaudum]AMD19640.1 HCL511Cp [Eremothecium sinecaudum]